MKSSIFSKNILKSNVLFLPISAFVLSTLLFTSCSESESLESESESLEIVAEDRTLVENEILVNDQTLISQIENTTTVVVDASSLPATTATVFNGDLADSFVTNVAFAAGLGYKVSLNTDNESREEVDSNAYFSLKGRQLTDVNEKRKKRRHKCFQFVFPIDFIMADLTSITLNSKQDWPLIKDWYKANPDITTRPELVFPVNVTLKDGTEQTLIDSDELAVIKASCKKGKNKRKCFKLVLPVSFTMPDDSVIEVNIKSDFKLVRAWRKANPDTTEKGVLNYPLDIMYRDATTATINNTTALQAAKDACN